MLTVSYFCATKNPVQRITILKFNEGEQTNESYEVWWHQRW